MSPSTITHVDKERARRGKATTTAALYMALDCEHLHASSSRHALTAVDEVVIGRTDRRTVNRTIERGARRLALGIPNRWLSSTHLALTRVLGRWLLEDARSKNGTFVNGVRVSRAELADGDIIEAGHVFFIFRASVPVPEEESIDVDASDSTAPHLGMTTLVPRLAESFSQLTRIAPSDVSVIVHGESGTGKELAARALHHLSGQPGPFIAVNCGALPASLVESELFGHKKGAFSGATEDRPGLVRAAHRGTLFLDEIGDLPAVAQPAFLRVLQEHEVTPVGGTQPVRVDVRVVCATHRDLDALVGAGKFRADLLARLGGFRLELLPLRSRREEIGMIVADLLARMQPEPARHMRLTLEAGRALMHYDWPLNVRELEKSLGAARALAGDGDVEAEHLPAPVLRALAAHEQASLGPKSSKTAALALKRARRERSLTATEEQHRDELFAQLSEHAGNISAVARALGKARIQIQRWVKRYGLDPESFRA